MAAAFVFLTGWGCNKFLDFSLAMELVRTSRVGGPSFVCKQLVFLKSGVSKEVALLHKL